MSVPIPKIDARLSDLEHPLIVKAQSIPSTAQVGSAERIVSLTDRHVFKVKIVGWRGAVLSLLGKKTLRVWSDQLPHGRGLAQAGDGKTIPTNDFSQSARRRS